MTSTKTTFYELGRGFPIYEDKPLYSWPYEVSYVPSREPRAWYFAEGDTRNGNGGFLTPREVIEPQWRAHLEHTQTLWLLPLLARTASGEVVTPQEIFAAYHAIHGENPPREERHLYY